VGAHRGQGEVGHRQLGGDEGEGGLGGHGEFVESIEEKRVTPF
jgi:hypothetical protein